SQWKRNRAWLFVSSLKPCSTRLMRSREAHMDDFSASLGFTDRSSRGILDTIEMIEKYRLDIRTVTMGISLLECARGSMEETATAVYDRVTSQAARLVEVCEGIERELGIPIVNK